MKDRPTIEWTRPKLEAFKLAYKEHESDPKACFVFEGNEFLVGYAKYLIEYLEKRIDKNVDFYHLPNAWLKELKVGDTVTRMLAGVIPMDLKVSEITDTLVICGPFTFSINNGAEIDDDLGWTAVETGAFIKHAAVNDETQNSFSA